MLQRLWDRSGKRGTLEEAHPVHSTLRVGFGARSEHRPARFIAVNGTACAILGGEWLRATGSGTMACVLYAECAERLPEGLIHRPKVLIRVRFFVKLKKSTVMH